MIAADESMWFEIYEVQIASNTVVFSMIGDFGGIT
jgi:hypothetical protein